MALLHEIEAIREGAVARLNSAHDYFFYTQAAWRTLQQAVQLEGLTFSWRNFATQSVVDQREIVPRAQGYVAEELISSTLQQFVSIFEGFLFDALRVWLLAFPGSIYKRQISAREILYLPDKTAIVSALVEKELKDVFYDRPSNWFEYVDTLINLGLPSQAEREQFAEIKATRDVLVHGGGIANAYYADKAGGRARAKLGEVLDLPEPYHQQSWNLLLKLVWDIGTGMMAKC